MRRPPILLFSNFIHSNKFTGSIFRIFSFLFFLPSNFLSFTIIFLCVFFLHFQNNFPMYIDALLLSDLISISIILAFLLFTYCLQYFRNCFLFFYLYINLSAILELNRTIAKRNGTKN